jgi:hypothetical protein
MIHKHEYHLLGQFEGTPKLYECIVCKDQVDEAGLPDDETLQAMFDHETEDAREIYKDMKALQDDYEEAEATGN